mmetsp:Transcript_699/g.2651  ORF Transcript_699/g.2651 Transcript_699/m.2651 type:complete len:357 (-) Transcript_699:588-1658(-)
MNAATRKKARLFALVHQPTPGRAQRRPAFSSSSPGRATPPRNGSSNAKSTPGGGDTNRVPPTRGGGSIASTAAFCALSNLKSWHRATASTTASVAPASTTRGTPRCTLHLARICSGVCPGGFPSPVTAIASAIFGCVASGDDSIDSTEEVDPLAPIPRGAFATGTTPYLLHTPTSLRCAMSGCASTSFTTGLIRHVAHTDSTIGTDALHSPTPAVFPASTSASILLQHSRTASAPPTGHSMESRSSLSTPSSLSTASHADSGSAISPGAIFALTKMDSRATPDATQLAIAAPATMRFLSPEADPHRTCLYPSLRPLAACAESTPSVGRRPTSTPTPRGTVRSSLEGSWTGSGGVLK